MSEISFTGLGSGIDTASMIDALMSVEKRPVKRLETKQNLVLQKKKAFQSFNTLISGLQTSSQRLAKSETFQTFQICSRFLKVQSVHSEINQGRSD